MRKLTIPFSVAIVALGLAVGLMLLVRKGGVQDGHLGAPGEPARPAAARRPVSRSGEAVAGTAQGSSSQAGPEGEASLDAGPSLHGRVSGEDGRPLAGADIFLLHIDGSFTDGWQRIRVLKRRLLGREVLEPSGVAARATTGEDGTYAIPVSRVRPGEYQVLARRSPESPEVDAWTWSPAGAELDFVLSSGEGISGVVVSPGGEPVARAMVQAFLDDEGGFRGPPTIEEAGDRTETDENGAFALSLSPGTYRVVATAAGYSRSTARGVAAGTEGLQMILGPAHGVQGRVADDRGEVVQGAVVTLLRTGGAGRFGGGSGLRSPVSARPPESRAVSGPDGRFLLADVSPGEYLLRGERAGFVPSTRGIRIEDDGGSTTEEIVLLPGKRLRGTVLDPEGRPVRGAFVAVADAAPEAEAEGEAVDPDRRAARPLSVFAALAAAETDAGGKFVFDTLAKGTYDVSVESKDLLPKRLEGIGLEETADVTVRLEPGLRIEGRVLSRAGGEAIPGARVRIRVSEDDRREEVTDSGGKFGFGGLPAAKLEEVQVSAKSHTTLIVGSIDVAKEPAVQQRDFTLDASARLSGRITDTRGKPVPLARVTVRQVSDQASGSGRDQSSWRDARRRRDLSVTTRTGDDGAFVLEDVNAAPSMRIAVEHPDWKRFESETFAVPPGAQVEGLEYTLVAGGRIDVTVRDTDGNPVSEARVRAMPARDESEPAPAGGASRGETSGRGGSNKLTGPDGIASIGALDGREHAVVVQKRGYQPFTSSVAVVEDQTASLAATLLPENVITGVVRDRAGKPIPGAAVRALGREDAALQDRPGARAGEDGRFRVGDLGPGPYSLLVSADGYARGTFGPVEVNTDQAFELALLGAVAGNVFVAETGAPVEKFRAALREEGASDEGRARGGFSRFGRSFPGTEGGPPRAGFGGQRAEGQEFSDPGGAFRFDEVAAGDYVLRVTAEGLPGAEVRVRVREGAVTDGVKVPLVEGLSLTGFVAVKGTAEAVSGAEVFVIPLQDGPSDGSRGDGSRGDGSRGDGSRGDGSRGDPRAEADARRAAREQRAEDRREGVRSREKPSDEQALATKLLAMAMQSSQRSGGAAAASDDAGGFELRDLPPGKYMVVVHHEAYVPARREVTIDGGFARSLRFDLDRGETLEGTVAWQGGSAAAGAIVSLRDSSGIQKRSQTDLAGRYAVGGLIPGSYTFQVRTAEAGSTVRSGPARVNIVKGSNQYDSILPIR